jgi:ribose 5-phosphate isomerase B
MTGNRETIAIASDHAGFELKEALKATLEELGFSPLDLGTHGPA